MFKRYPLILVVIISLWLTVNAGYAQDGRTSPNIERRTTIDGLMAQMTLQQKVAQLFMVGLYGPNITDEGRAFLETYQPGAIVVFPYNAGSPSQVTQLINDWQTVITEAGAPPLLVAIDQEGGRINTLEDAPFTQFPVPALVTATANYHLIYETGVAQSRELQAVGIHMNLAPVADLETNPDNPVIFRRAYGSDPLTVAPALAAMVQGMQTTGVMATLKHFPGHGDTNADSHIELPILYDNRQQLEQAELMPFRAGIGAGAEAVMVGHLWLPELDPTPSLPASLSHPIATGILREELGFDGIIMTDALDMDAIDTAYTLPVASVMAIQAGIDVLAMGPHVGTNQLAESIDTVLEAVERGEISEAQINGSVRRILDVKRRYGVLDWQPLTTQDADARVLAANSQTLITQLFQEGTTLVYDQNAALPFSDDDQIVLAYPLHRPNVIQLCTQNNVIPVGFSNYPTESEINEIVRQSYNADYVVVLTQNAIDKPEQAQLVNQLPPEKTVVVAYWSPYDILAFDIIPTAYMVTYSPFDAGLDAACQILSGERIARGRLTVDLGDEINTIASLSITRR